MPYRHLIAGLTAAGVIMAGSLGGAVAAHADGHGSHGKPQVNVDYVLSDHSIARASAALVAAAKATGNQRVTMVIMERSGVIREVVRTRKAGPQTYESAKRKAFTAVSFGQPTSALVGNEVIDKIPGTLTLPGGVPVMHKGFPIAGIGVGGAPDGRIDERIANMVLRVL